MSAKNQPQPVFRSDYAPPDFQVERVTLYFSLHEDQCRVSNTMSLRRSPGAAANAPLVLNGGPQQLLSLRLGGEELPGTRYQLGLEGQNLQIADVPDVFELVVETALEPHNNTALEGLYKSGGSYCTQCEAQGFRRITWYPDRPDVMAIFTVTVEAEKARYPVLLANGNPVARGDLDVARHFVTWEDPHPKPSYLFALVAGDLVCIADRYTTASGRSVALQIYVEPHNATQCEHALASLQKAMRWDEETFGLEYDLDSYMIVAVDDFNMGAMENKGLNIFNAKFILADQQTATDLDYQNIESVVAHEYFHNWTGNRVTCRDWFQLSLKEGLTVFREQEFSAAMNSRAVRRIADVRLLRERQFVEDAGPTAHPVRPESYLEINNFYTLTVYEKGAEVVRMLHTLLGPEKFRKGMDVYFQRHDGQAVSCDDFVRAMADASGTDLHIFQRWYSQAGTPQLRVTMEYDGARQICTLHFSQSRPGWEPAPPLHIPVRLGLLSESGQPLTLYDEHGERTTETTINITQEEQTVVLERVASRPVPSLLRGFSAPVKLACDYSNADLALLMATDSDEFNRWDAGQQIALRVALQLLESPADSPAPVVPQYFLAAFRQLLTSGADDALLAEALRLPSEETIGEEMRQIDMQRIFGARQLLCRTLADYLREELRITWQRCAADQDFSRDAGAIARRSLKNACLSLMAHGSDHEPIELAAEQARTANNMSDEIAALRVLCDDEQTDCEPYLQAFYQKWQHDRLVIDKWFALQAMSRRSDTLAQVQNLTRHKDFTIKNPNRARALLHAFAVGNPVRFHAADGSGYRFLGDHIIALNRLNPQVAARLVGAMSHWRRFTGQAQVLLREQLQRILESENLSGDVYELVAKSLA